MTGGSDVHLLVDGQRLDPAVRAGGTYVFRLTAPPASVRVISQPGVPAGPGLARDSRTPGLRVRQIAVWRGAQVRLLDLEDATPMAGFHPFEPDTGIRWTNGNAVLPLALFSGFDGAMDLELRLLRQTQFPLSRRKQFRRAG